jgi:hypothetical protein
LFFIFPIFSIRDISFASRLFLSFLRSFHLGFFSFKRYKNSEFLFN